MLELVEAFDKLDENLDTKVTMDEFLRYQVKPTQLKNLYTDTTLIFQTS